jgi:two-component system CheB/CheR fusion protein
VKNLELSNKELERFAYVASHDLQEPLRKVSLFLQMLESKYKSKIDETADNYILSAVNSAKQMRQLIRDLLEYSHLGATKGGGEMVDMNDVASEVINSLETEIKDLNASVVFDELPVLRSSLKTQMVQLLQNLISNSLKYHSDSPPKIHITAKDDGKYWLFSVSDNGIGIDPEFHEKVFVIFRRLHNKSEYAGTGVGLSICKKIVEHHGGRIWINSRRGEGSTFNFTIPKSTNLEPEPGAMQTVGSKTASFVV